MLLSIITLLAIASILLSNTKSVCADDYWPEAGSVDSKSAVVMEASTGTILYEKHSNKAYYPASITKIMTAMLAIEYGNLSDTITFSEGAVYNTEGSSILRDVGEELSLKDCLYALMLESANDCAYAIAEYIAGDIESFADMMNEKAEELVQIRISQIRTGFPMMITIHAQRIWRLSLRQHMKMRFSELCAEQRNTFFQRLISMTSL